jgi:glutamate-ammonia-ligase adenylyltransferase
VSATPKISSHWLKAIKASAEPARARLYLERLRETSAGAVLKRATADQAKVLITVLAGSEALAALLVTHPEWVEDLLDDGLEHPRRRQEVAKELEKLTDTQDHAARLDKARLFKQRQILRIAARDLARLATSPQIIQEVSDLADVCLAAVWDSCLKQQIRRFGMPMYQDEKKQWHETTACVLGLGKLGGQELNYSSDVDVIFIYQEEGQVFRERPTKQKAPPSAMTSHVFYNRLAENFTQEVSRLSSEGVLYRMDLRLRPEGDAGPLTRSLASYENFYAQYGQTWERMMLIKARTVAGDQSLGAEFIETIQPFRYPRSLHAGVLKEIAAMKDRIENEILKSDELERNVKLGEGGIREIEFVAQSLQLLHAGRQPFLQGAQTLPTLAKLAQYELLSARDAELLTNAYVFLRDVEHRLQMENNRQTHTIPADAAAQLRLARLMGFATTRAFKTARQKHSKEVSRVFDHLLKSDQPENTRQSVLPADFDDPERWTLLLGRLGFRDVPRALRMIREFVEGPGYVHVSERSRELAMGALTLLLEQCPGASEVFPRKTKPAGKGDAIMLSDPDRVVTRLDSFIQAYHARANLFELWNSNRAIFHLLVLIFDRSEFLAELAIHTPDLVDELVASDRLRQRKSAQETFRDLSYGIKDKDQHLWLRRYHQAELLRIGSRDILGLAGEDQYLTELTALADATLQYATEVILRKHSQLRHPPFAVIGLGKLGGGEIDYGSDLDIIFVADPKAGRSALLAKMAAEIMELISARTEAGMVFHVDARLRPDGEKGVLVAPLDACEDYYQDRAQLWELQTLSRARSIAGNREIGRQFEDLAARLTNFASRSGRTAGYTRDWKQQIHNMRMRIEKERTPKGQEGLAIKTGAGGLIDAEFMAQALALENGWREPSTLKSLERANKAGILKDAEVLISNYKSLRRVEGILRRWSYEGESVLPSEPEPFHRVAIRCGFKSDEEFREALSEWRRVIRQKYLRYFGDALTPPLSHRMGEGA